jgi:hypothetical protein
MILSWGNEVIVNVWRAVGRPGPEARSQEHQRGTKVKNGGQACPPSKSFVPIKNEKARVHEWTHAPELLPILSPGFVVLTTDG